MTNESQFRTFRRVATFVRRDARQFSRDVPHPNASLKNHRWPDGSGKACCCRRDCRLRARATLWARRLVIDPFCLFHRHEVFVAVDDQQRAADLGAKPSSVQRLCSSTSFCLSYTFQICATRANSKGSSRRLSTRVRSYMPPANAQALMRASHAAERGAR